jgi:hypothetical protein
VYNGDNQNIFGQKIASKSLWLSAKNVDKVALLMLFIVFCAMFLLLHLLQ